MLMNVTPLDKWIADKIGGQPEPLKLRAYQLNRLRETLVLAKNSRFYAASLRDVNPDDIQTMGDIARLPFTAPADIATAPNDFLCVSPRDIERIVTLNTSGTTGKPKRVFFTDDDQELTVDFFHHGMTTMTDETDRVLICMPGSTPGSVGDLLKKGLSRFGCSSVVYGPVRDDADALDTIINEKITCIVGIPSQMISLARLSEHAAIKPKLKSVLLSADYVPRAAYEIIRNAWGSAVYEHYGMTETGLGGAVACAAHDGYHMREADLLYEIVDPISGLPVPDGIYGEVVFSTLTRRAMPLIRYKTGDRARMLTQPCPCGTVLRRLDRVTNRLNEPVTLTDGAGLSVTQLDEIVHSEPSVSRYSAELRTADGQDCLHITVRPSGKAADLDTLRGHLEALLPHLFSTGKLLLDIEEGTVGYFTTGTLKRQITDSRC